MIPRKPRTLDDLRAITVGELVPLTGPIPFVEYDPRWPEQYAREERRIRSVLGERVLRIQHTGSTSVPGLAAKPTIDITITIADVTDEPAYAPDLEAAGYVLRVRESEPEWWDHRMFRGSDPKVNLHVFSAGCTEPDRMVGFRNWLRAHDDDRQLYEQTKRELIGREWQNLQQYADAKTDVVEAIAARAALPAAHP
jgi:GrpB-like predicted nucleotidyltransferase (UPF0157 family)